MMATVGRVGRAHGLDGSFYVTRPEPGALKLGMSTSLGAVVRLAGTAARPILRLEGVDSRTAADALRGQPLLVAREEMPLEEGEYWADDLVGLRVVDGADPVGVVERVRALPSCEVLEVGERLIPLIDDAVRAIDLDAGIVDVDLGFVDGR
jgi:16S rRNA processing protein RimM